MPIGSSLMGASASQPLCPFVDRDASGVVLGDVQHFDAIRKESLDLFETLFVDRPKLSD